MAQQTLSIHSTSTYRLLKVFLIFPVQKDVGHDGYKRRRGRHHHKDISTPNVDFSRLPLGQFLDLFPLLLVRCFIAIALPEFPRLVNPGKTGHVGMLGQLEPRPVEP